MSTRRGTKAQKRRERDYDRQMMRAAFQSLFLGVIQDKKKSGYQLQQLAADTDNLKSTVSRWFSPNALPNWQIDTISDICDALGLKLELKVTDIASNVVYSPQGVVAPTTSGQAQSYQVGEVSIRSFSVESSSYFNRLPVSEKRKSDLMVA
jgi:hypothetical protein